MSNKVITKTGVKNMNNEEMNKNRLDALARLDFIIDEIAYSGLTAWEYEALKTTRRFIQMRFDRDKNER